MELDEMKVLWKDMNQKIEQQKSLTDQIIEEMTKKKYRNTFRKVYTQEFIGSIISYIISGYILLNFEKMEVWYLEASAIIAIAILTLMPTYTLNAIYKTKELKIGKTNLKESITEFEKRKKRMAQVQRINIVLCMMLLIVSLPVMSKIISGVNVFTESKVMYWYLPIGYLVVFFILRWAQQSLKKITNTANQILLDLE